MELILRSSSVHDQACRSQKHRRKYDAQAHLCLADAAILDGQASRESVGAVGERESKAVSDGESNGDEAAIDLTPTVGRLDEDP